MGGIRGDEPSLRTPVEDQLEQAVELIKRMRDAAYSVLCESNGLSDNEWRTGDGKRWQPRWPMASYPAALETLSGARSAADAFLDPVQAAKEKKWIDACATASAIMDRFKEDTQAAQEHPNLIRSSLHRNIADAINGTLVVTAADRATGKKLGGTMADRLTELVARGDLVKVDSATRPKGSRKGGSSPNLPNTPDRRGE